MALLVPTSQRPWLAIFNEFITHLRIDSKETTATDNRGSSLVLWGAQQRFLQEVCEGLDRGVRDFYCLKSRQLGISTVSLAIDIFWLAMHPGMLGVLVVDNDENREKFRLVIHRYIASFPRGFFGQSFGIVKGKDNKSFTHFSNGSTLDYLVAGKRKKATLGESRAYNFAHLCVARGTPVIISDGYIKPIEEVKVGDTVLTHTGAQAKVIDALGQPNTKGPMIRIRPWLGQPILCTDEHTIPTQRGIVEAKDLRRTDLLVMPLRKITRYTKTIQLQETRAATSPLVDRAEPWVRVRASGAGATIALDEEFGFAIGYYLAEGNLKRAWNGNFSSLTFARHRSESPYTDRALKALTAYTTGHVKHIDRPGTQTSTATINGTPLCQWIFDNFGGPWTKFIPDKVFEWGDDFCRGLLCGVLCGDGSKTETRARDRSGRNTYPLNHVVLPTIHSSMASQIRDIAAALGYGWGSIAYKAPHEARGRVNKGQWRVAWNGSAAAALRELMGLPSIPRVGHNFTQKYRIEHGLVYLKIKDIQAGFEEPEMWDLSVDHEDHTFRTPFMAIGNTEVANYGDPDGLASFRETLAQDNVDRLYLSESTAKGYNHWHDMYYEAKRDELTKKAFFIGWWAKEINCFHAKGLPPGPQLYRTYGAEPPNREEQELIDKVLERHKLAISRGQLAWYRYRESDSSSTKEARNQNLPWLEEQAFVLTGYSFFQTRVLNTDMARIQGLDEGSEPVEFKAYRFWVGNDFFSSKMEQVFRVEDAELRIWEEPSKHGDYVIGCDPAYGRSDEGDNTSISVWRCYADKLVQVAEYTMNKIDTRQAAWILAYLAGSYRNCIVNLELTGGVGMAVMTEFKNLRDQLQSPAHFQKVKDLEWEDFLNNARWFLYHRPDSLGAGYVNGFMTTRDRKFEIMNQLRDLHVTGTLVVNSLPLTQEMLCIVQDGGHLGAQGTNKDDRVFAAALAARSYIDWVRPKMLAANMTYDRVLAGEEGTQEGDPTVVDRIVADFFRRAEEREAAGPEHPKWMVERGLV